MKFSRVLGVFLVNFVVVIKVDKPYLTIVNSIEQYERAFDMDAAIIAQHVAKRFAQTRPLEYFSDSAVESFEHVQIAALELFKNRRK